MASPLRPPPGRGESQGDGWDQQPLNSQVVEGNPVPANDAASPDVLAALTYGLELLQPELVVRMLLMIL